MPKKKKRKKRVTVGEGMAFSAKNYDIATKRIQKVMKKAKY